MSISGTFAIHTMFETEYFGFIFPEGFNFYNSFERKKLNTSEVRSFYKFLEKKLITIIKNGYCRSFTLFRKNQLRNLIKDKDDAVYIEKVLTIYLSYIAYSCSLPEELMPENSLQDLDIFINKAIKKNKKVIQECFEQYSDELDETEEIKDKKEKLKKVFVYITALIFAGYKKQAKNIYKIICKAF
ncbi:hypothetical protein GF385_03735 [Candidatus Dependentiae bacterium]|nr:hypothetical protein [Candidatus Dependentiae bacterium]